MQKIQYNLPIFEDNDEADLNDYSMKMANAIKVQIDKFGNPLTFKGAVKTLTSLQELTDIQSGYIYRVNDENRNYIYNGKEWVIYSDNLELVFYKYTQNITENILANQIIEIPCRYKVGDYLDVYYMGERLIKNTKTREGHYNEIGEEGSISNQIQVGWNINAGSYFDFILRENTQVEIEENEKIAELQQKNIKLEQELKELNKDLEESSIRGEVEAERIHLEDSSNCRCKIHIKGNSKQETNENSPSPENISEIYNVGDNGSVNIKVKSENLKQQEEQTIHFNFKQGQVLHKEDYLATDGIHYKRKTVVLDGTENFTYESTGRIFVVIHDIKDVGRIRTADILCSHFKVNTSGETKTAFHYQKLIYFFPNSNITSLIEWKAWLTEQYSNGTPVTIEYELADEEIEEYTKEQQEEYKKLNNVRTYKTITNISNDSNAILKVDYIKDLETVIKNIIKEGVEC